MNNYEQQKQPGELKNFNSAEAKELAGFVTNKFNEFKLARASKETKWNECVKAFLSQHNYEVNNDRKWRSQIYVPLSYEAATNIYSNLKRNLFPTDSAFFTIDGITPGAKANAAMVKSWLLHQLDEMNFITKFGAFLKQLVVTGNSAAAVYWKKVTRRVREKVYIPEFDESGNIINQREEYQTMDKVVYNGPEFETLNMLDVVFDPGVTNWEDGLVIHRSYRSFEQVKNNPVYKNTDSLATSAEENTDPLANMASQAFSIDNTAVKKQNLVKLYSAYGDFKVGDNIYYDYIAVVANDTSLIRFEPNPYPKKPFIFCVYENVPNEIYGIGAIEPGLGIQYLVNTFSNQKADVLSLLINGMWAYVDDGVIDPEEIVARPGALIAVRDPNNIRPLHPDTNVVLSYNEIAQLKAEFQEVTGATKYFTGGPNLDFRKTATEVSALQSAGVVRFSEVIQNIEQNALKRVIELVFLYNGMFGDRQTSIKSENEGFLNFIQMSDLMINANYNFRIIGANSTITKDIRVNKLIEFISLVAGNQKLAGQIDVMQLVKELYRELGFKDESRVFISQQVPSNEDMNQNIPM